jgi:hypothetical protein
MRLGVFAAAIGILLSLGAAQPAAPALTDLRITGDGDSLVASCRLESGLTPEILEEIDAGLETTIGYRLYVYRRRTGLPDETIAKRRVRCTVRYDALTRQYTLTRRLDGDVQDTHVTGDPAAMRSFLTVLNRVPIAPRADLAAGQQYYLRAKSDVGFIWRFYLIPWPLDTDWVKAPIRVTQDQAVDAPR